MCEATPHECTLCANSPPIRSTNSSMLTMVPFPSPHVLPWSKDPPLCIATLHALASKYILDETVTPPKLNAYFSPLPNSLMIFNSLLQRKLMMLMDPACSTKIQILTHSVPLSKNHKKLKRTELQETMQSMTHFQKLTKLSLWMAMSPSAIRPSILAHASHTTSEKRATLKLDLLLQTKTWAPWWKYGITPILIRTASISYSEQFLRTFYCGDARIGHSNKPYLGNLKYSSIVASGESSTSP